MISDTEMKEKSNLDISKKYSFKPISTRKYYIGKHHISIIVNGEELIKKEFELI